MPLGNPPNDENGDPAPWADPVTLSSTAAGGLKTLEALVDLVGAWDSAQKRFETIKILRVMSLRLWSPLDRNTGLKMLPEKYFDFYCDPRMSRAYAAAGLTKAGQKEHLDFDWYGAPGETWWPTKNGNQRDGRKLERRVVHELLNYLEWSIDLSLTNRGWSWTTWEWPWTKSTPWDDLRHVEDQPLSDAVLKPLEIRWTLARGADMRVKVSDDVLKITTPRPADLTAINLS
jgi:hypothetical protein